MHHLHREQLLPCTIQEAWDFFSTPRNLNRLTPKSIGFKITHLLSEEMHLGQLIGYKIKIAPLTWVTWLTEITHLQNQGQNRSFTDDQRLGPYRIWHHTHRFEEQKNGVLMTDHITYALPLNLIGKIVHQLHVKKKLNHIFDERRRLTHEIFAQ